MQNRLNRLAPPVLFLAAALFVLTGAAAAQKGASPAKAKTQTLTGFVGDSTCGITHISGGAKKCTVRCVKSMGAKYALVNNGKTYTLEGKEAELEKVAGEHAKVTGSLQGTTMKVTSVTSAKYEEAPDMD